MATPALGPTLLILQELETLPGEKWMECEGDH